MPEPGCSILSQRGSRAAASVTHTRGLPYARAPVFKLEAELRHLPAGPAWAASSSPKPGRWFPLRPLPLRTSATQSIQLMAGLLAE